MENTVAKQIKRKTIPLEEMESYVMEVRLALIVLAAKTMNMLNVHSIAALTMKLVRAHQVINTLIWMESTVAEQIERKSLTMMVSFVMVVRLALIVLAAKKMIMQNVHTIAALILKTQIKMKLTMRFQKTW